VEAANANACDEVVMSRSERAGRGSCMGLEEVVVVVMRMMMLWVMAF